MMPIRDMVLTLLSYPDPTPEWAIAAAAAIARQQQAVIEGALCIGSFPQVSNVVADRLVDAGRIIAEENARSRASGEAIASAFAETAGADAPLHRIAWSHVADPRPLAELARLFDLSVLPVYGHAETASLLEALVFSSGRPVMLLPETDAARAPGASGTILIGWDGSRPAARALADALPFLATASAVEIVAVTGEKALPDNLPVDAIVRHLARHGIEADGREVPAEGKDAGTALLDHAERVGASLLVMGAYGQSKFREFVLGGATRTIVSAPRLPVLLSH